MNVRIRKVLFLIAVVGAAAAAIVALLRLVAPTEVPLLAELSPGLLGRLAGEWFELVVGLGGSLAALAAALLAQAIPAGATPARTATGVRSATLLAAAVVAMATPGGVIAVAGYLFAVAVLGGLVVLAVLLVLRRPAIGIPVIAALAAVSLWVGFALDGFALLGRILASVAGVAPTALVALAHLGAAAALVAWLILTGTTGASRGEIAAWVRRHRVVLTAAAALCAAPYVVARATWLTPWPLFAPDPEVLESQPAMRLTGLMLGLGMLAGAVLTTGLVLRWGERFPRWMAGSGGRMVPVAFAVLPATLVAVLFTIGGVEVLITAAYTQSTVASAVEMALMLPFWLWGPLLGLATWGYAMHRRGQAAVTNSVRSSADTQSRVN